MSTALLATARQDPASYVLVVADDVFIRKLVRGQLEAMGLSVQEALSVARGVSRFRAAPPSLVLLDLWVEHGAGIGFIEETRGHPADAVPVLLLGAESRPDVRHRAFALGAVGPVPVERISTIADWVEAALTHGREGPSDAEPT
jgi:CheY-like chemotaxis protein